MPVLRGKAELVAVVYKGMGSYCVQCQTCGAQSRYCAMDAYFKSNAYGGNQSGERAVNAWNRRHNEHEGRDGGVLREPLGIKLVGAVNVNKARMNEHAERLGKLICKLRGVNQLEAVMVDEDGEEIDRVTVFR